MPVEIKTTCDDREVKTLLGVIRRRTGNLRPAMKLIGEVAHDSILKNFREGGRPKWAELSKVTKAMRKKEGKWPGQILMRSGAAGGLSGSIHPQVRGNQVILTARKKYAALQHFGAKKGQFGTRTVSVGAFYRKSKTGKRQRVSAHTRRMKIPWGDIPARPFMVLHKEVWPEMRASLLDYLLGHDGRR